MNRDLLRMLRQAHERFGVDAVELVFRAYTAGLRDASSDILRSASDLGREFEKLDVDKL